MPVNPRGMRESKLVETIIKNMKMQKKDEGNMALVTNLLGDKSSQYNLYYTLSCNFRQSEIAKKGFMCAIEACFRVCDELPILPNSCKIIAC